MVQIWCRALENKHFFKGKNRDLEGHEILKFWVLGLRLFRKLLLEHLRAAQRVLGSVFLTS